MYVCICNAVTDRAIREAADQGVSTMDELAVATGCGSTCGCCRTLAVAILDAHIDATQRIPCAA